ncbi:hypothetical protein [Ancylobacter sp. FA202]|uniref:hypothetical protein n=1 Tax=Ancylobacter sp. FA202 TaxID=1111106 RepID=UPI00035D6992|nr:hypothetical protein [Ancylobacter sp. FA202]
MAKRDNAYYRRRLETEHPTIFQDLKDGKYASEREAFVAAGLRSERTRLHELKNAWRKSSRAEQAAFMQWLKLEYARLRGAAAMSVAPSTAPPTAPPTAPGTSSAAAVDSLGHVMPWAKARIQQLMARRGLKLGDVMAEMGFKKLNPSLALALNQDSRLRDVRMVRAVEKWIREQDGS